MNKLPIDIIREHIIPYTYSPQPNDLCNDIRSFKKMYVILTELYEKLYINHHPLEDKEWLINDMERWMNNDKPTMFGYTDRYINIIRRIYSLRNKCYAELCIYADNYLNNQPIQREIQLKLGALKENEREDMLSFIRMITSDE